MSARASHLPLARSLLNGRRLRRVVQVACLLLFLYLAVVAVVPLPPVVPVDLFLRIDPLLQIAASLAGRALAPNVVWALPLVVASLFLGRFFCGWVCPLGTTLDVFRLDGRPRRRDYPRLRPLGGFLLPLLLVGAALGSLLLVALDPLTLFLRALATGLLPALNLAVTSALLTLYQAGIAPDLAASVDGALRPAVLPAEQHAYQTGALLTALLVGVVALNLLAPRFWCRYVCPLGALFGLLGRIAPLRRRIGPACDRCGQCVAQCKMAAISPKGLSSDSSACVQCLDCLDECPRSAISLGLGWREPRYSPSRRRFLAAAGLGVAGVAVLRVDATATGQDEHLVRPPGAAADFLERCVRCGQCVKVCPTSALQPAGLQSGWEGLWSPVVVARLGNCDWNCNACGQVCPTGAIQPLSLNVKRQVVIGAAYIDQNRCIPWADGRDCIVCQEMCPLPEKAIALDDVDVPAEGGTSRVLRRPRVLRDRCIGCGVCENRCPVSGAAAIRVYSTAEAGARRA